MKQLSSYMRWYWRMTPKDRKVFNREKNERYKLSGMMAQYYQRNRKYLIDRVSMSQKTPEGKKMAVRSTMKYNSKNKEWYLEYHKQYYIKHLLP